ncbi:phosphatidylserine lipase ABHD16A isoform X2 [Spodoptera frugiperda]|uniref:Phosphatidylserine lipase ABHD16A isoform X2 n=1 Tax=Spodoptera frugiperda TaxID=7108 RepID=A0A9R0CTV0_SPOFR|nr:phosphatidylserine lipase ABHD16A isoform X2 [Spodoptera frugiperda]
MKQILGCLFSPRLYKVYRDGPKDSMYQPVGYEKWGDKIIITAHALLNISLYTSPFICFYIYKRGFLSFDEVKSMGRLLGGLSCLMVISFLIRAYGRSLNPKYIQFVNTITNTLTDKQAYLTELRKYDFDIKGWPVTFSVANKESSTSDPIIRMDPIDEGLKWYQHHPFRCCSNPDLRFYKRIPLQILAFSAVHTFGLRLIYPGSLTIVNSLLWAALLQGRTTLVENHNGKRARIGTADGNTIDTMFVDNRTRFLKGKILVICCEGNSGFYEIGIMTTPMKCGYSALGWNHPGFAGSSGLPYPSQEHNAIDAVMQYAINELGFRPENIILFGWSIGGYTATWAAVNYPIGGLILDATFDDLLPLAQNQMPPSWSLLVKEVIRSYVDLNIADLITKYNGPVKLIRRTEDEIISLRLNSEKQGILSTNRGNDLLMKVIDNRHPKAVEDPHVRVALIKLLALMDLQRNILDRNEIEEYERSLLPLIGKYLHDYRSSHCTPLPESDFVAVMQRLEAIKQE